MLKRVTGDVSRSTGQRQRPQRLSRLTTEFYFNPAPPEPVTQVRAALPQLVALPGGIFMMGCDGNTDCPADEKPIHAVKVSPFLIAKHETTFAQWDACVAANACQHRPSDEGWGRGSRPVVNVSWGDATTYAEWISSTMGRTCRLPTEAEWEFAARAGTASQTAFGDEITPDHANFDFKHSGTQPVGAYPANAFDLFDMHGNVWEWVSDRYDPTYYARSAMVDPQGPETGMSRVFRGGSWMYGASALRASERNAFAPTFRSKNVGFRIACD